MRGSGSIALGQNVNSYHDETAGTDFADLLRATARAVPEMRIRYTTSPLRHER